MAEQNPKIRVVAEDREPDPKDAGDESDRKRVRSAPRRDKAAAEPNPADPDPGQTGPAQTGPAGTDAATPVRAAKGQGGATAADTPAPDTSSPERSSPAKSAASKSSPDRTSADKPPGDRPPGDRPRDETAPRKARSAAAQVRPVASPARAQGRHWGILFSFLLMVIVPVVATTWYVYDRAVDQYASTVGFTVRSEDISSAVDILGGIGSALGGGGGGSSDSDILYEFIRSRELVATVDARLDLRSLYSRHYRTDPVFGFDPSGAIEDLATYWRRVVRISYDANSGLMELRVLAFTPEEAKRLAEVIYEESTRMINDLSAIAREDATRYAREDLDLAVERLKTAREALTAFRIENQIVDLSADIQGQMGLLNTLQAQLAEALIELDLIQNTAREGDPRLEQAERRIEVIEARIEEERQKFGAAGTGPGGVSYATTVAEFERLTVDREFAEQAYVAALSAYDGARAEANRQSRYLAAYIQPTLAETAEFPQRGLLVVLVAGFAFLVWSILTLVYYSIRDRP